MSPAMTMRTHGFDLAPPDLGREDRPELVPPEPHRLMRDVDAAPMQQILDVARREGQRIYGVAAMRMISGEVLK